MPKEPFLMQSKMIVDKFGPEILVPSLYFTAESSLQNILKENHEILQLYLAVKKPHTGTRAQADPSSPGSQTVGVPLRELAQFRSLIAGQPLTEEA